MPADMTRQASDANGGLQRLASSDDLTAIVMTAMGADVMRALQFTAVIAFSMRLNRQGMMAATHATAGRRGLSFGNSHEESLFFSVSSRAVSRSSTATGIDNV